MGLLSLSTLGSVALLAYIVGASFFIAHRTSPDPQLFDQETP